MTKRIGETHRECRLRRGRPDTSEESKKRRREKYARLDKEGKAARAERWRVWRNKHKEHHNAYMRKYKKDHGILGREKDPLKNKARYTLANHVHKGKIKRGSCEICQEPNAHAHHEDYNFPLNVRWLCPKHHSEVHKGRLKLITSS